MSIFITYTRLGDVCLVLESKYKRHKWQVNKIRTSQKHVCKGKLFTVVSHQNIVVYSNHELWYQYSFVRFVALRANPAATRVFPQRNRFHGPVVCLVVWRQLSNRIIRQSVLVWQIQLYYTLRYFGSDMYACKKPINAGR